MPQSTIARIESGLIDPRATTLDALLRACGDELASVPCIGVGVDRTLIRSMLRLSPRERLENLATFAAFLEKIRGRARRST